MSDDPPPDDHPSDKLPYGVDTIRMRISWPAAPASRGYNGRKWSMRPLRGWTGRARQDASGADAVTADRDGLAAASPVSAPAVPDQGQVVAANQAVEGGGPASELLAAFHTLRADALQDRGPKAEQADAALSGGSGATVRLGTAPLGSASPPSVPQPVSPANGSGAGGTVATGTKVPAQDVTASGGPISAASPDPYASNDVGGTTARLGMVTLPGVAPARVTADQLRATMPSAGDAANRYAEALNRAMATHGINTPAQRAAFLAQVSAESEQLRDTVERLNYSSARRLQELWPLLFPTEAAAAPYVHNPEALANRVYAGVNGNRDEASGDGYRYRGRGLMQVTGRGNYRDVGFENDPEELADPQNAADSAAAFWQDNGLNRRTAGVLDRAQFDDVTRTVNRGGLKSQERWDTYQRALRAFNLGQ